MSCCCCFQGTTCVPVTCCKPSAVGPALTCVVLSDTLGAAYRAFATRPKWLGGDGSTKVDGWTKQVLKDTEAQQLVQAGMAVDQAKAQACKDVEKTIATAPSLKPCYCSQPNYFVIVGIIAALAIAVIIFSNVAAHRALD